MLEALRDALAAGRPARAWCPTDEEPPAYRGFNLLTAKPVLYAANVSRGRDRRGERPRRGAQRARSPPTARLAEVVTFSAKVEAELAELPPEDRADFLESLGLTESGLDRLAHAAYHLLGLQSYFTAGEKEVRAWTIHRGDKAPPAAGVIHTDFERGFIRAETVGYDDFVRVGGWKPAREQGLARAEGKEYVVRDGDVMLFRFSLARAPYQSLHELPASQPILLGAHTGPGRLRPKEGVMTRQYEVVYIFDSALEEAAINERLARFHALSSSPAAKPPR